MAVISTRHAPTANMNRLDIAWLPYAIAPNQRATARSVYALGWKTIPRQLGSCRVLPQYRGRNLRYSDYLKNSTASRSGGPRPRSITGAAARASRPTQPRRVAATGPCEGRHSTE